jgi:hypothetical protein
MSQTALRGTVSRISLLQIAIIILALATALVHLDRALSMGAIGAGHAPAGSGGHPAGGHPGGASIGMSLLSHLPVSLQVLFLLNFIGYIVLAVALYLPVLRRFQRIIRWVLIVYAAITIIMWFLVTGGNPNLLAYIDKPIEVGLIVLLVVEDWQAVHLSPG